MIELPGLPCLWTHAICYYLTTPLFIKFPRFSPPLTAKTPSLCRPLLLTDVTQAFVTFWYTPRYKTTHLTRNNPPEFINATIHAVSPFLFSRKAKQITFSPKLVNKEKSLTTYPANPKTLIYLIQCNKCKCQYIGETKRQVNERFGEHCRSILNHQQLSDPTPVSLHFNQAGHSINNVTLIPLELTRSNRDAVRKAREAHLILKGNTLSPLGINSPGRGRTPHMKGVGMLVGIKPLKETDLGVT